MSVIGAKTPSISFLLKKYNKIKPFKGVKINEVQ